MTTPFKPSWSDAPGSPPQRRAYTKEMGGKQCEWCLTWFRPGELDRTTDELGALKTWLMIPDSHMPLICNGCFDNVMAMRTWNPCVAKVNWMLLGK